MKPMVFILILLVISNQSFARFCLLESSKKTIKCPFEVDKSEENAKALTKIYNKSVVLKEDPMNDEIEKYFELVSPYPMCTTIFLEDYTNIYNVPTNEYEATVCSMLTAKSK